MPQQTCYRDTQEDILQLLDKVLSTGEPVEIERRGKRLLISPAEQAAIDQKSLITKDKIIRKNYEHPVW